MRDQLGAARGRGLDSAFRGTSTGAHGVGVDGGRRLLAALAGLAVVTTVARSAEATLNAGLEAGIAKRSASDPGNLKPGFGWQLHGEFTVVPALVGIGPYYTHYELSSDGGPFDSGVFSTMGLRGRVVLPLPGSFKPYGYVGIGYAWVSYNGPVSLGGGHFLETPIGGGIAYAVLPMLQLSLDAAYRPGMAFGGDAYDHGMPNPSSGYTVLLGAAIDI